MEIRIDVSNAAELSAAFTRAPDVVLDELTTAMNSAIGNLGRETAEATPKAAGTLRRAWITRVDVIPQTGQVVGRLTNPENYAIPVELGTKPHWAPIAPLINWAEQKFNLDEKAAKRMAYGKQRNIALYGTRAHLMANRSLQEMEDNILDEFAQAAVRIRNRIAASDGGGAVNPGGAA